MKLRNAALLLPVLLAGCAGADKALDAKVAQETQVKNNRDLRSEADRMIANDPNLTADQKSRLEALRQAVSSETAAINRQELRLRGVLTEEVLSPDYDSDEVALIKRRMKKLEKQKLSLLYDAIDQGNNIMGKNVPDRTPVLRAMMEERVQQERD